MVWLGLAGTAGLADEGLEVVGSGLGAVEAGGGLAGVPLALAENDGFDGTVGFEDTNVGFEDTNVGFVVIIGFEATVGFED